MAVLSADGVDFDFEMPVVVIGAGACGLVAALAAHDAGQEVMILERDDNPQGSTSLSAGLIPAAGTRLQREAGIDDDPDIVQALNGQLSQVVRADSTKEEALRQLAVPDFDYAVVGIGTNVEASILTASLLVSFGIGQVWAKALSEAHGRILTQLGVAHVVFPEADMGRRIRACRTSSQRICPRDCPRATNAPLRGYHKRASATNRPVRVRRDRPR